MDRGSVREIRCMHSIDRSIARQAQKRHRMLRDARPGSGGSLFVCTYVTRQRCPPPSTTAQSLRSITPTETTPTNPTQTGRHGRPPPGHPTPPESTAAMPLGGAPPPRPAPCPSSCSSRRRRPSAAAAAASHPGTRGTHGLRPPGGAAPVVVRFAGQSGFSLSTKGPASFWSDSNPNQIHSGGILALHPREQQQRQQHH